jgi:glycosyltransferase involved in cell wall biosynthesis
MTLPMVSIVVPVFNGERFIDEALASLRREQNIEAEIIVVDDGSIDSSLSIVKSLAAQDPRIRLIAGDHRGVSATRNIGVRAAIAEYITFLDCDDICPPGRIARQALKLVSHTGVAVVVGETLWFEALTPDLDPVPGTRHMRGLCVTLHSALFRRSVFETYGLFDEQLKSCEDLDFFLRISEGGVRFLIETEIASLYRRHPGNMTKDIQLEQKGTLAALRRSIARRRAAGRNGPLDVFFTRHFAMETVFSSTESPSLSAAQGVRPSLEQ